MLAASDGPAAVVTALQLVCMYSPEISLRLRRRLIAIANQSVVVGVSSNNNNSESPACQQEEREKREERGQNDRRGMMQGMIVAMK